MERKSEIAHDDMDGELALVGFIRPDIGLWNQEMLGGNRTRRFIQKGGKSYFQAVLKQDEHDADSRSGDKA